MQPVTIKTPKLIDGLWLSQFVLAILIVASVIFVTWPWWLLTIVPIIVMARNFHQIIKNKAYSVRLNQQWQWFVIVMDQLQPCQLSSYWHIGGILWIRLESEHGTHYFMMMKRRLGGALYAQLLMAVNQNEQQTE